MLKLNCALLLLTVLTAPVSNACRTLEPFKMARKDEATTVFQGRIVKYELKAGVEKAEATFGVKKTIRGEARKTWVVSLEQNTNLGVPKSLEQFKRCYGVESEVGLSAAHQKGGLATAVQGPCHPPYIIPLPSMKQDPFCLLQ